MRRISWFLVLVILLKLGVGPVMAMPAATQSHPTLPEQHSAVLPACHGHGVTPTASALTDSLSWAQASHDPTSKDPASHAHGAADADCHHCCAVGLGCLMTVCLHPTPAAHAERITHDWESASLRPDLRPPIA